MGGTKDGQILNILSHMRKHLIVHGRQSGTRGQATAAEHDHSSTWMKLLSTQMPIRVLEI